MSDTTSTVGLVVYLDNRLVQPSEWSRYFSVKENELFVWDPEGMFWTVSAYVEILVERGYSFSSASSTPSSGNNYQFWAGASFGYPRDVYIDASWLGYKDEEPTPSPTSVTFTIYLVTGGDPGPDPEPSRKYSVRTYADTAKGWSNPSIAFFAEGAQCTVSATAKKGYKFSRWTCLTDGATSTSESHTFTVTGSTVWLAEFVEDASARFRVTTSYEGMGTTSPSSQDFSYGEQCTIVARPNQGWIFGGWVSSTGEVSGEATHTFQVTSDQNWHAVFQIPNETHGIPGQSYTVTTTANGNGSASPWRQYVLYGNTATITAEAGQGGRFVTWIGPNGERVDTPIHSFIVTRNEEWTAYFVDEATDPGGELHRVSTTVASGKGITSGDGLYRSGISYTVSAVTPYKSPTGGTYVFKRWRDSNGATHSSPTVSAIMGNEDIVYNAYYEDGLRYKVYVKKTAISPTREIQLDINTDVTGTGLYYEDDTCTLTATPYSGAKLILFYTVDKEGNVEKYQGGTAQFKVKGDTDVYALSLYEQTKLFYDVYRNMADGTSTEASVEDIEIDGGLDPKGSIGTAHKVGDKFTVSADLKKDVRLFRLSDNWIDQERTWVLPASNSVLDIAGITESEADCEVMGDCDFLYRWYTELSDHNPPYFLNDSYVAASAFYEAGTFHVAVTSKYYTPYVSAMAAFKNAISSTETAATFECGTDADLDIGLRTVQSAGPGWKFYAMEVRQDDVVIAEDVCKDGKYEPLSLATANIEMDKTVSIVLKVWHEHDGKILCNGNGDVLNAEGGSILCR